MYSGGDRYIATHYRVNDTKLTLRPYNAALATLTAKICNEVGKNGDDRCDFEARTAFDCLLRHRVTKFGDITDNIGMCKHHISNMKEYLPGHEATLDKHLTELNYMSKSFV